jgi:N-acetyl-gamma-glutamylphosphate reductase
VNLSEVFLAMKASTTKLPDAADAKKVKAYFEKVYPDMDFSRVYASDMKKMVKWFEVLDKNKVEIKLSEIPQEETENMIAKAKPAEQKTASVKNNAPAKKINSPRKMA